MFVLTMKNSFPELIYHVWNMDEPVPARLIKGSLSGVSSGVGEHVYSYGFGGGRGRSKTAGYDDAIKKINDIIKLASRGFNRLNGYEVEINAIGYQLMKRPAAIEGHTVVTQAFLEKLKEIDSDEKSCDDLSNDIGLIEASTEHFFKVEHAVIFDEFMDYIIQPEVKMYPVHNKLSAGGRINKFTNGALRFKSIIENTRKLLHTLPRRIVICDIDEVTQITAMRGGAIIGSSHEFGGASSVFSSGSCGAINPAAIKGMAESTGMSYQDIFECLSNECGVKNFEDGFDSIKELVDAIRQGNINTLVGMFLARLTFSIAGLVALLGGIDMLIISGRLGVDSPALRTTLIGKLGILRLAIDENQNEDDIKQATEITGKGSKVKIVVARPEADKQMAVEVMRLIENSEK
ncbi:MAG: hypothetical protein ABIJ56_00810 [Pseudomonadota bacterium]